MATDKKTPRAAAPISSSSMRAAFCSFPTSVEHGHPGGRRRVCSTVTGTTGSPSAAAWRCRPNTGGSRCTCAVSPGISPGSTSAPSSGICFGICVAPWCSSGIVARSIAGGKSGPSSRSTRAWTSTSSPPRHPNSTRPSTSGRRPIAPLRTAPPIASPSFGTDWTLPPAVSAARNGSSGPASMRPISRGRDEYFHYLCESQ